MDNLAYYHKQPMYWYMYYGPQVSHTVAPGLASFKKFMRENAMSYANPTASEYEKQIMSVLRKKKAEENSAILLGEVIARARINGEVDGVEEEQLYTVLDREVNFHNKRYYGVPGPEEPEQNPSSRNRSLLVAFAMLIALKLVSRPQIASYNFR